MSKNPRQRKKPELPPIEERNYYTATEARAKLGMTHATFFREDIPRYNNERGKYPKEFIDALASARQMVTEHMKQLGIPRLDFSKSTPAQQKEEMQIGIACFGPEFITPLDVRLAFQMKNPYTFWSLKAFDPMTSGYRAVAYISMFRFPDDFLNALLEGTHIEIDITLSEVLQFEKSRPFPIYIDVLATDPGFEQGIRSYYAWVTISRFANEVLNLRSNGYLIEALYTVTTTPEGDNLVRKIGFQLLKGKSKAKGRLAYKLELDEAGLQRLQELSRRGERDGAHSRTENA